MQQDLLSKLFTTHFEHVPRDFEEFEKYFSHFDKQKKFARSRQFCEIGP